MLSIKIRGLKSCLNIYKNQQCRSFFNFPLKKRADTGKYQIVVPGKVSNEQPVPEHIQKPDYYYQYQPPNSREVWKAEIKTEEKVKGVRQSSEIAARILEKCSTILKPGLTTEQIDQFVHNETIKANAYPSPLRYAAFPKSVCTSVNNVACHGIPDDRPLANGDIINIDVTVYYKGFHGDCSKTFLIGDVDEQGRYLVKITEECLYKAIAICGPTVPFKEIGATVEDYANSHDLRVMREFIGHGIGSYFHGTPEICHYRNKYEGTMMPGMTFTIEPILCLGNPSFKILRDEWTAVTKDNSRTAQFEHTILITKDGCEILTIPSD